MSGPATSRPASSTPDARTRWFHEARFGIFIHWGVYAVPAGEYRGKPVGWIGEWIMHSAQIPVADYRAFARDFNASAYDPQAWADLFHDAGARYVIITAKHHEGFALYDSPTSAWNSVRSSPAARDLLAPLADSVRAHGLRFGLYYSQAQDWVHPGGGYYNRDAWDPAQKGDFDAYLRDIALPQTRELIERFSPDILWWDTPVNMTPERARPFAEVLAAHPEIITNDRLGGDYPGDTKTPEQHIPPRGYPGEMFEVCMTMNDTWGFKKNDHAWKPSREIIRMLSDISSKGGNFLLNVGPDASGRIPEPSVKVLQDLGRWMRINSNAIYATTASPFPRRLPWGRVTQKTNSSDGTTTLFLHVWDWPADSQLLLPTLQTLPVSAQVLGSGADATFTSTAEGIVVHLPGSALHPDVTVVRVELPSAPVVTQTPWSAPAADGTFTLHALDADTHGSLLGNLTVEGRGPSAVLARWHSHEFRVEYVLRSPSAGRWRVEAELTASVPVKLRLKCGRTETPVTAPATPAPFTVVPLGEIDLPAGDCLLELLPVQEGWSSLDLRTVRLIPVS